MSADEGYAHPELLAETEWLQSALGGDDPSIVIIDCDNRDAYRRAHLPGAISLVHPMLPDPLMYLKNPDDPTYVLPPEQFAQVMGDLGIGDQALVVAYDGFGSLYATRLWWCLSYYGHQRVKVLNGGWNKWLREGRPVTDVERKPRAGATFTPRANPDLLATAEGIMAAMKRPDVALLDVRSHGEWTGENTRGNRRSGHMPGAVHLEWLNYVDDDLRAFKPAAELRQMFQQAGVTPEKEVTTY